MEKVSILAITKNGIKTALVLKKKFTDWKVYAPKKFSNGDPKINWYDESTGNKISELFKISDALICLFSLGAVIRLISPHIKDKKNDPAVIVIDDKSRFVISTLSGHLGGANELTEKISDKLGAIPVVTTAADVNQTIPVDLVGKKFGWKIDDDVNVTKVSALMVNEEKIGIYQDTGQKNWWDKPFPKNVKNYNTIEELKESDSKGYLVISDRMVNEEVILKNAVIYRPPSLVVGLGLHNDTPKDTINNGLEKCLKKYSLSYKSIVKLATIKNKEKVEGLLDFAKEMKIPIDFFTKEDLAKINIPNPSYTVKKFEGTSSVSEASALKSSSGILVVEKQKFPPNLTIAIARKIF